VHDFAADNSFRYYQRLGGKTPRPLKYFIIWYFGLDLDLNQRNCPTCDSTNYFLVFRKSDNSYVCCNGCGTVFINPIPDAKSLADFYDDLGDDYFLKPDQLALDHSPEKYIKEIAFLKRVYKRFPQKTMRGERLLEVGCATGSFLVAAKELGYSVVQGLDISKPAVKYARSIGLDAAAEDFTATDRFPAGSYDIIIMWALLEHLSNPRLFIRRAHELLADGGILLASVPNSKSLSAKFLGTRSRYVNHLHLNYFTAASMGALFGKEGLQLVYHETQSINPIVILGDLRGAEVSTQLFIHDYERTHIVKSNPLLTPIRWMYSGVNRLLRLTALGDLLLVAAQKI
jgi:2-polyprenyl-3-methyl-5-hydroxy-6-metoxy-1,4-benzoquinol methylase